MIRIWIDEDGVVRLEARGVLETGPVMAAHEEFYREEWEAFVAADLHLADYRQVDLSKIHGSDIRALAERNLDISRRRGPLKIAVVIDDGVGYGLARMWEQQADATGWPIRVFTDEEAAWSWLLGTA